MRGHGVRRAALILALVVATAAIAHLAEVRDHRDRVTPETRATAMSRPWLGVGDSAVVKADGQTLRITDRPSVHHDNWSLGAALTAALVIVALAGAAIRRPSPLAVASASARRMPTRGPPSLRSVLG
jgi:hypothetical protein